VRRKDVNRAIAAAVEAAFEDDRQPRRKRLSGVRAIALGAALAAGARVVASKAPSLPRLDAVSHVPDLVRDRLTERGWLDGGEPLEEEEELDEDLDAEADYEEPEDEAEVEPEAEEEPEPEAEADVEPEAEEEPEPEAEADVEPEAEEEPEPEAEEEPEPEAAAEEDENPPEKPNPGPEDQAEANRETPDVIPLLSSHSRPPVMAGSRGRRRSRIRPAARPPSPPRQSSDDEGSKRRRSKAGS
jgi:outer membrane biosynthesis protein TonB